MEIKQTAKIFGSLVLQIDYTEWSPSQVYEVIKQDSLQQNITWAPTMTKLYVIYKTS